jgi:hypothetical protein
MTKKLICGLLAGSVTGLTAPLGAAEKRHAHSHVHGVAEVTIAVEGKKLAIEFVSPADGLMGFEHEAKTDADKKKRDAALKILESRFDDLVILDKKLGCKSPGGKVAITQPEPQKSAAKQSSQGGAKTGGEHREARARFDYECQQAPAGSRVRFGVTKLFPQIHELKVQVLGDAKQSAAVIKKDKGEIGL